MQPKQDAPWVSAGPVVPEPVAQAVREAASRVLAEIGPISDFASAVACLEQAWAGLSEADLDSVRALRSADTALQKLQLDRITESTRVLTKVISRMESASVSVPGLVELAPQLICELGFDRGLISRVEDGVWYPELMFIMGDPRWAEEITQAGKAEPTRLRPGLHETEMLTTRSAILVTEAQADPRHGHRAMVEASLTRSYVGAPILSGGKVVGLLHADRYGAHRHVDEIDRQLLAGFAEAFRLVLSRAALADELQATHPTLRGLTASIHDRVDAVHRTPLVRLSRDDTKPHDGLVVRVGARQPEHRPLPDTLTRRELEVLALMAAGRTNPVIAQTLVIADGTVKQHVKHVLRKLGAANRAEAVARWFQAGGLSGVPPQG